MVRHYHWHRALNLNNNLNIIISKPSSTSIHQYNNKTNTLVDLNENSLVLTIYNVPYCHLMAFFYIGNCYCKTQRSTRTYSLGTLKIWLNTFWGSPIGGIVRDSSGTSACYEQCKFFLELRLNLKSRLIDVDVYQLSAAKNFCCEKQKQKNRKQTMERNVWHFYIILYTQFLLNMNQGFIHVQHTLFNSFSYTPIWIFFTIFKKQKNFKL